MNAVILYVGGDDVLMNDVEKRFVGRLQCL